MYRLSVLVCVSLFMITSGKHPIVAPEQKSSTESISSSTILVTSLKTEPPTTEEFVPSVKSDSRQGSLYLSSEDLSNVDPHESDDHDHSDHEDLDDHNVNHEDDHDVINGDDSHDHEDHVAPMANSTDLEKKSLDHVEIINDESSTETTVNDTETTTFQEETEGPVDLTVTDATGCFMALRDQMEQRCFDKFQGVLLDTMGEQDVKKVVCCALEDYEKCSLRGYQKTHCESDTQGLKESLRAGKLFVAAMHNVSCFMHRGRCSSASAMYTFGPLTMLMGILLFFFL